MTEVDSSDQAAGEVWVREADRVVLQYGHSLPIDVPDGVLHEYLTREEADRLAEAFHQPHGAVALSHDHTAVETFPPVEAEPVG